ncbi:glutathione S-transferase [Gloeophyllum trabeum ATCC 11539]|uniref:glutathione transferase n=1 Tax=Gloeophyllum trabeum (strain ATCC 11539 / FP-39264 / Madison 617) TaxID=670483 RepID=S7Q9S9_GLOTA|nr:glutathione S-transferase [Gloeophyllum trabeum ATCC 11539]EPQ56277.1 glutathione S-transferase [Gloeophyllum trabeum ATCC 11539]
MSHGKQFTLYTHKGGPNGWKAALLLSELGLSYESIYLDFERGEQKTSPHVDLNPNGRIPTIVDHGNNDFVLWESNAILLYLAERYDPDHTLSASTDADKYKQLQWLFFQASGQGPYFGQLGWFSWYHHEKVPSAIERYAAEAKRVLGVLDGELAKREWLVGDKYTIADLSFIPWTVTGATGLIPGYDVSAEAPHVDKWLQRMLARPAVRAVYKEKDTIRAASASAQ